VLLVLAYLFKIKQVRLAEDVECLFLEGIVLFCFDNYLLFSLGDISLINRIKSEISKVG